VVRAAGTCRLRRYRGGFAGEGIDMIRSIEPAGIILGRVVREAEAAWARRFT
jgi:hypothetical protein